MQKITTFRRFLRILLKSIPDEAFHLFTVELETRKSEVKKRQLKHFGKDLWLASNVNILVPGHVSFGDNCALNEYVHILGGGGLHCGNNVWIANHASLVTSTHPADVEFIGDYQQLDAPITIEDDVWIGSHAVILPGITLGKSCIVGAGAVVTKDVPPYAITAGVPAKVLRYKDIPNSRLVSSTSGVK